jgi:hypothetical protein
LLSWAKSHTLSEVAIKKKIDDISSSILLAVCKPRFDDLPWASFFHA